MGGNCRTHLVYRLCGTATKVAVHMRRILILHGTNGDPKKSGWQKWVKERLTHAGYDVFFPHLPHSNEPDLKKYDIFLKQSDWDFSDNIVIAHSSGTTALLHLLGQEWFPSIQAAVLVGTFLNVTKLQNAEWYTPGQFDRLFVEEFDVEKIAKKTSAFYFIHGDDDPYCDYDEAKTLCKKLNGTFTTVYGGGHLSSSSRADGFPELLNVLRQNKIV